MHQSGAPAKVDELVEQITSGELVVFKGPINDTQGVLMVEKDQELNDGELLGMEWFVEGVITNSSN